MKNKLINYQGIIPSPNNSESKISVINTSALSFTSNI